MDMAIVAAWGSKTISTSVQSARVVTIGPAETANRLLLNGAPTFGKLRHLVTLHLSPLLPISGFEHVEKVASNISRRTAVVRSR